MPRRRPEAPPTARRERRWREEKEEAFGLDFVFPAVPRRVPFDASSGAVARAEACVDAFDALRALEGVAGDVRRRTSARRRTATRAPLIAHTTKASRGPGDVSSRLVPRHQPWRTRPSSATSTFRRGARSSARQRRARARSALAGVSLSEETDCSYAAVSPADRTSSCRGSAREAASRARRVASTGRLPPPRFRPRRRRRRVTCVRRCCRTRPKIG